MDLVLVLHKGVEDVTIKEARVELTVVKAEITKEDAHVRIILLQQIQLKRATRFVIGQGIPLWIVIIGWIFSTKGDILLHS